jgi:hypothetical protein
MFDRLAPPAGDALHGVMARYRADPRPEKIDLGVGVYRDETGASPVMQAVRDAERLRIERQDSKAYQALSGDLEFIAAMTDLVFGPDHPAVRDGRVAAIQGTGGTGSLRIALELARSRTQGRASSSACRPGRTTRASPKRAASRSSRTVISMRPRAGSTCRDRGGRTRERGGGPVPAPRPLSQSDRSRSFGGAA